MYIFLFFETLCSKQAANIWIFILNLQIASIVSFGDTQNSVEAMLKS